jgi:hypothetical protein
VSARSCRVLGVVVATRRERLPDLALSAVAGVEAAIVLVRGVSDGEHARRVRRGGRDDVEMQRHRAVLASSQVVISRSR